MREYYGFMKEIKGVKGTVMGNFLNFFLSVREKNKIRDAKRPSCHLLKPSFWNGFKAHRTECGVVMLANERLW